MTDKKKPKSISLEALRTNTAELLALAVRRLFPEAELAGGGLTSLGFHYDFICRHPIDEQMLDVIEQEMFAILKSDPEMRSLSMMRQNAVDFLKHHQQPLRAEQASMAPENIVELIQIGDFYDLCPEPHVESLEALRFYKLLNAEKVAKTLPETGDIEVVRIHGTVLRDPKALKKFLKRMESAKKNDHRIIINELDLASTHELTGIGCWLWHPKGTVVKDVLTDWWRQEHLKQNFEFVSGPGLVHPNLLKKGNITKFLKNYHAPSISIEGKPHVLTKHKTLNHALIFARKPIRVQELPIRYAELSEAFDPIEESRLWGLFQTRTYLEDQATIFCAPGQAEGELISSLQFIDKTIRMFGFEYHWCLSHKSSRQAGTIDSWNQGIQWLMEAAQACGVHITTEDQESESGALFKDVKSWCGPRLTVAISDAMGRLWEGPSLGIDLNAQEALGLSCQGHNGTAQALIVVVRSIFASLERFAALLLEQNGGRLPLWLAPEQARIIPVRTGNLDYAKMVLDRCLEQGLRATIDNAPSAMSEKIYAAGRDKVPYVLILGDKEQSMGEVTMRSNKLNDKGSTVRLDNLLAQLRQKIDSKTGWQQPIGTENN